MADIECENCGGNNFYKEAGFYFCTECQVQSQEIQEHVFEEEVINVKSSAKITQETKKDNDDNKITSWECYNYILKGLTDELINLGAQRSLKQVVKIIWLKYLEKLEVFQVGTDAPPKIQAVGSKKDAEIIYGKRAKRKRAPSSSRSAGTLSDDDLTSLDSRSLQRERHKRKRKLMKAHYNDLSQQSIDEPSLTNETLISLQSSSDKSKTTSVVYNCYAQRELRKKQSASHLRKHKHDLQQLLRCHKVAYKCLSHGYRTGPYILSLNKLYAILYLGLLINHDRLYLSDMLKFIKKGCLSFNCYTHFFPDDFTQKSVNFRNFLKINLLSTDNLRTTAADIAKVLHIVQYICCPNLVKMCDRFCKELNLPDEISSCVKNIISNSKISMRFKRSCLKIPNYEGRVLSIILVVLKLFFGLDNITDQHISDYSNVLNSSRKIYPKMFNFLDWLKFIKCRSLILENYEFAYSSSINVNSNNLDSFLSFMTKRNVPEQYENKKKFGYFQMLKQLKNYQKNDIEQQFEPYFNNSMDELKKVLTLLKNVIDCYIFSMLERDFSNNSLVFLLFPNKYLKLISKEKEIEVINGGVNNNWIVESVISAEREQQILLEDRKEIIPIKLNLLKSNVNLINVFPKKNVICINNEILNNEFVQSNELEFQKNVVKLDKICQSIQILHTKKIQNHLSTIAENYSRHYNFFEKYWLRLRLKLDELNKKEFNIFLNQFPSNFVLVVKEFSKICAQSEQEFLSEFQFTELHLVYCTDYNLKESNKNVVNNLMLNTYLKNTTMLW